MLLLNFVPVSLANKDSLLELNLAWPVIIAACVGYIKINKESGIISTILYIFITLLARSQYLNAQRDGALASLLYRTLVIKAAAWALQILGHKVFESNLG